MIDLNLMKQVTDLADWLFNLRGRNQIDRLEELRAVREAGEQLWMLYGFKGNVYQWVNRLQAQQQVEEVQFVRELFGDARDSLEEIEKILLDARLSNLELASQAGRRVAEAKAAYAALAKLSDADILEDRGLIDLIAQMDHLMESGAFLVRLADHHRAELEASGSREN